MDASATPEDGGAPADAGELADAGSSQDGGTATDGGSSVVWRQSVNGFQEQQWDPGCVVSVDSAKVLTASVVSADDGEDTAVARFDVTNVPPTVVTAGRLRGYIKLPAAPNLISAPSTFLRMRTTGGYSLVRVQWTNGGAFHISSADGVLAASGTSIYVGATNVTGPNEYLLDIAWRAGDFLRVQLNAEPVATEPLGAGANATELVSASLGIDDYEGTAPSGWTVVLRDWVLATNPDEPLAD